LGQHLRRVLSDSNVVKALDEKRPSFTPFESSWWELPDFAYQLTRTLNESRNLQLDFINDPELRRLVAADYSEAKSSLAVKNHKATILLSGSIAEALLIEAIVNAKVPALSRKLIYEKFVLNDLIGIASKHKLIHDDAILDLLKPIRKYRNLIHPGVQLRNEMIVDAQKAEIAIKVVDLLILDLGKRY
jgi:hypothetical protein